MALNFSPATPALSLPTNGSARACLLRDIIATTSHAAAPYETERPASQPAGSGHTSERRGGPELRPPGSRRAHRVRPRAAVSPDTAGWPAARQVMHVQCFNLVLAVGGGGLLSGRWWRSNHAPAATHDFTSSPLRGRIGRHQTLDDCHHSRTVCKQNRAGAR